MRPGTQPVPLIVGLGLAAELAGQEHGARRATAECVRAQLVAELQGTEFRIHGDQSRCQPHVLNVSFPGVDSEALMMALRDDLAVSNGAACTSQRYGSSHVLEAMGLEPEMIRSAIRLSWGPGVTAIPAVALRDAVLRLR